MPLGVLIVTCFAVFLAATLALLAMQAAFLRGWRRAVQALVALAGMVIVFFVVFFGGAALFDLLYPFAPAEVPQDAGFSAFLVVLDNIVGGLRPLDWAEQSAYAATAAWLAAAIWRMWQNWRV